MQSDAEPAKSKENGSSATHEFSDEEIIELEPSIISEESINEPVPDKTDNQIKQTTVDTQMSEPLMAEKAKPIQQQPAELQDNKIIPLRKKPVKELLLREKTEETVPAKKSYKDSRSGNTAENNELHSVKVKMPDSGIDRTATEHEIKKIRDDYLTITNLTGDIIVHADKAGQWTFLNDVANRLILYGETILKNLQQAQNTDKDLITKFYANCEPVITIML